MTSVKHLNEFESRMKAERGLKRHQLCDQLGVSQGRWRRYAEMPDHIEVPRDLGLLMAAIENNLRPYGEEPDQPAEQ